MCQLVVDEGPAVDSPLECLEVRRVVAVVHDHVIAGADESVVLESAKPGHTPTIVLSHLAELNDCRRDAVSTRLDGDDAVRAFAVEPDLPLRLRTGR